MREYICIFFCAFTRYKNTYLQANAHFGTKSIFVIINVFLFQFWPLVEINCSPDLRFFLCSLYAPICLPTYTKPLPACRSVCERAKNGCAPLMRMYGFAWPERMRCEDLPEFGDSENLCMDHNTTERTPTPPSRVRPVPTPSPYLTQQKQNGGSRIYPQDNSK